MTVTTVVVAAAARGGIVQFNGPLFLSRRPRVPLTACLWLLIRHVTGGVVFLPFLLSAGHDYALYFSVDKYIEFVL